MVAANKKTTIVLFVLLVTESYIDGCILQAPYLR